VHTQKWIALFFTNWLTHLHISAAAWKISCKQYCMAFTSEYRLLFIHTQKMSLSSPPWMRQKRFAI